MRTPYQILNLRPGATADQIKRSYRSLARKNHPDQAPGNPDAENAFKEISAAYDLLSDPHRRARYDRGELHNSIYGSKPPLRPGKTKRHSPFSRFFRKRSEAGLSVRGADISYSLSVDFIEAALGTTRRINLTNGKQLEVKIPAATADAQVLRLGKQGIRGIGGGDTGDALVSIRVKPHPLFTRNGDTIEMTAPVTVQDAVLGGKITVQTIDGSVALTIPKGSNTDTILRLKERGLQIGRNKRGDQLVRLKIVLPEKTDKEFNRFIKNWGPKNSYDPNDG